MTTSSEPRLSLRIATPSSVPVDDLPIASLRAEDISGAFGVHGGHANLVTLLIPSVVRWIAADGEHGFCVVDGGVLTVEHGAHIEIACRDAICGGDLASLEEQVTAMRAARLDTTRRARAGEVRLHARTVRQIVRYLRGGASGPVTGEADVSEVAP